MSVTPFDLLRLARELRAGADEAAWRGAVSRAYYAAFHHADSWHMSLPSAGSLPGIPGGKHHDLAGRLTTPSLPTTDSRRNLSISAGYMLREAHKGRIKADYLLREMVTEMETDQLLIISEKIVSILG